MKRSEQPRRDLFTYNETGAEEVTQLLRDSYTSGVVDSIVSETGDEK